AQLATNNSAPTIVSNPGLEAWALRSYSYQVRASDANNDELCFSIVSAPEGMNIDVGSGFMWWQPSRDQIGVHSVEVLVTDQRGASVRQNFSVAVGDPNDVPVIQSFPNKVAVAGYPYRAEVTVSDS